ncbi:unnamed protein product [Prorocentrum cordatum]|uniref:PSII 6.1 kDa protein n=1 Tax=Prorocentrum cordatum TaxID=2364126 RepID=A0ABN9UID0_9DINO|nr:unnamed protein product [Polarella glacialis]
MRPASARRPGRSLAAAAATLAAAAAWCGGGPSAWLASAPQSRAGRWPVAPVGVARRSPSRSRGAAARASVGAEALAAAAAPAGEPGLPLAGSSLALAESLGVVPLVFWSLAALVAVLFLAGFLADSEDGPSSDGKK